MELQIKSSINQLIYRLRAVPSIAYCEISYQITCAARDWVGEGGLGGCGGEREREKGREFN